MVEPTHLKKNINWIISPGKAKNKKCLKPPPRTSPASIYQFEGNRRQAWDFFFTMLVEFPIESPLKPPCLAGCHGITCKGVGKKWVRQNWQNPNKKEDSNLGTEATMISGWIACTFLTYTMCCLVHNNVINQHWENPRIIWRCNENSEAKLKSLAKSSVFSVLHLYKTQRLKGAKVFFRTT